MYMPSLTFATLLANSADNKLMTVFFFFYQKTRFDISLEFNLHWMSNPVSWEKEEKMFQNVVYWKFYLDRWALTRFQSIWCGPFSCTPFFLEVWHMFVIWKQKICGIDYILAQSDENYTVYEQLVGKQTGP